MGLRTILVPPTIGIVSYDTNSKSHISDLKENQCPYAFYNME